MHWSAWYYNLYGKKYTDSNYNKVIELVISGISMFDIRKNQMYAEMYQKEMLVDFDEYKDNFNNRNKLFFNFKKQRYISKKKLNSIILIFGAGAAGSTIAILLAQFGFNNIVVVDDDIVQQSDIEKTMVFRKEHFDRKKIDCIREIIYDNFSHDTQTLFNRPNSKREINEVVARCKPDLVIKACDPSLGFRINLNEICFQNNIPFIQMSYSFDRINIGPFFIPGITSCDNYFNDFVKKQKGKEYDFLNHEKLFSDYTVHPSTSFNINILSNFVFVELMFFFMDKYEFVKSLSRIIFYYPLMMKFYSQKVQCVKSCYCQSLLK